MNLKEGLQKRIDFIRENNIPNNTPKNIQECEKEINQYIKLLEQDVDMEWDEFLAIVENLASSQLGMF